MNTKMTAEQIRYGFPLKDPHSDNIPFLSAEE